MISFQEITYTRENMLRCYEILGANHWDIVKAFSVANENQEACGDMPSDFLLRKLQELCCYRILRGFDFEAVWRCMLRDQSEMMS